MVDIDELRSKEIEEIKRYVKEYNLMFGYLRMGILGARFGKRIRKLFDMPIERFLSESYAFHIIPLKTGGFRVWTRGLPFPEENKSPYDMEALEAALKMGMNKKAIDPNTKL